MNKILTVVVPMYNVEKYIPKCLESFVLADKSCMDSLEVLCINDGTPDHSADIAKEYEAKYPQTFRVIDKENGNYGSCINRGLKEARGKYIRICDGDDSYDSVALEELLKKLLNVDVDLVITDFKIVSPDDYLIKEENLSSQYPSLPLSTKFNMPSFLQIVDFSYWPHMHSLTYRTSMLQAMKYHQTEGISYTDQMWATLPITHVKTAYYVPSYVYRYLLGREGQTMDGNNQVKNIRQLFHVLLDIARYCEEGDCDPFFKPFLCKVIEANTNKIYPNVILFHRGDKDALETFDRKLAQYPTVYSQFSKHSHLHGMINYVEMWRRNNYDNLPFLVRKLGAWLEKRGRKRLK